MDTANLDRVARRYRDAEAALDAARAELQTEAVDFLRQNDERGAVTTVVRITGWSREHLRRLRDKAEMEALRRKVDELSTARKSSPAVAASRQQVTQALPKPEPIDLTGISPEVAGLSLERVRELAASAEARQPQWVAEIREEYPDANELRLCYLIVDVGFRQGRKPPELADPPAGEPERPVSGEEASG
jgi:hypothetical protein